MTPTDLSDLIVRVEGASEGSRELDCLIADAVLGPVKAPYRRGHCEKYTTSIDAAMTLVAPSWWFNMSGPMTPAAYGYSREDQRFKRCGVEMIGAPYSCGAGGATFPLAICVAALRARITPQEK